MPEITEQEKAVLDAAKRAIRKFPWDNYGLDEVDPRSKYAEWVGPLAEKIVRAVEKARTQIGGE